MYEMQLIRRKIVESAKESIKQKASNSEIYGKMQAVFIEIDSSPEVSSLISNFFLQESDPLAWNTTNDI